jgi:rSAM/selenodomain-associated transferase 2
MQPEELTIVVPLYKEAAQLAALWHSLAPLRESGVEVILVNAQLPPEQADESLAIAAALNIELLQAAKGRAGQMNAGAAQSMRPWLLFLHADTRLPEDVLLQLQALPSNSQWGRFDVWIEGRSWGLPMVAFCMNWRSRLSGIATGDQAMFVRRDLFNAVGGFPQQPLMEDIALSRALRSRARPVCLFSKVITSGRRWDTYGLWPTIVLMWRLRFAYWRGASPDTLAAQYL